MAKLLGKTRMEIEEILNKHDIIEINLSERKPRYKEEDDFRVFE